MVALVVAAAALAATAPTVRRVGKGGEVKPVWLYTAPEGSLGGVPVPGSGKALVPAASPLASPAAGWSALHTAGAPDVPKYLVAAPPGREELEQYLTSNGNVTRIPGTDRYAVFESLLSPVEWIGRVTAIDVAYRSSRHANITEEPHHRCAHTALQPLSVMTDELRKKVAAAAAAPLRKASSAEKALLIGAVNSGDAEQLLRVLSGADPATVNGKSVTFNTRMSTNPLNEEAAQWIAATMLAAGACDEVDFQEFTLSGSLTRNVICKKFGSTKRDEVVVVGAHFDSIPSSGNAPGAVDNGSGSVSVMLVAQALAKAAFERTIHFICFSGEEQGLHGSRHYVNDAVDAGVVIPAAITMDMTAYSSKYFGVTFEGTRRDDISAVMDNGNENLEFIKATSGLGSKLTFKNSYVSFGSDHVPFQQAGYAGILMIEQDDTNYPGYHRTSDQVSYCNWDQMSDIARIATAQAIDYAGLLA
eukprot:TRINITY_DN1599_c0_g1_i1.p1 TRINITY_DN1599_c0_g1~~TRINITY_DN1599_c0_g1_i1.p1  ORF type:complete len:474 (+),score=192.00 TRINITY_DN1599_c0_g1_i1:76-1497(+)